MLLRSDRQEEKKEREIRDKNLSHFRERVNMSDRVRKFSFEAAKFTDLLDEFGYLRDSFRSFMHISRYAKFLEAEKRFETWPETVTRFMDSILDIMEKSISYSPSNELCQRVFDAIVRQDVLPSLRCLYSAGPALEKDNIFAYNCAGVVMDELSIFAEIMYLLMCGAGVGYSVERKYTEKLPVIAAEFSETGLTYQVPDDREGWSTSLNALIHDLSKGLVHNWDFSLLRPKGTLLKTTGGFASGPEPLIELFNAITTIFKAAAGRKLRPIEVHDINTRIAACVILGGGKRSSELAAFDIDDVEMRECKTGSNGDNNPHRFQANNSAAYPLEMPLEMFRLLWREMRNSKRGEPGIFNIARMRTFLLRRLKELVLICNPCGEVLLRKRGLCNLSEVNIRPGDTEENILFKVVMATVLGTWQSSLVNFPFLCKEWKQNCEEERLLGVSLAGVNGNPLMGLSNKDLPELLERLKASAIEVNAQVARQMGINASVAVTTVKPSGKASLLSGVSWGLSGWYDRYFVQAVRAINSDPLCKLLKAAGVKNEPDAFSPEFTTVFYFPRAAPEGAVLRSEISALQYFELWKTYRRHWTEHNPSVTIEVKEHEWDELEEKVFQDLEWVGGLTFYPAEGADFVQPPYASLGKKSYTAMLDAHPANIDYNSIWKYTEEGIKNDTDSRLRRIRRHGANEMACSGGECAIPDIV